jgi:hypothetical protein
MVKHLLDALSSLELSTANDGAHRAPDALQSTEQSVLIMMGQALTTAATMSPEQAGRHRNIFDIPHLPPAPPSISAASITQSPSRITAVASRVMDSLTTATSLLMSPPRKTRTRNGSVIVPPGVSTATAATSPCQGHNNKRARGSCPPAVTDNLGWGRSTIEEFAQFSVGDQLVIVIGERG